MSLEIRANSPLHKQVNLPIDQRPVCQETDLPTIVYKQFERGKVTQLIPMQEKFPEFTPFSWNTVEDFLLIGQFRKHCKKKILFLTE